jgi:thiol-disulfide isomerase/thioredoxin
MSRQETLTHLLSVTGGQVAMTGMRPSQPRPSAGPFYDDTEITGTAVGAAWTGIPRPSRFRMAQVELGGVTRDWALSLDWHKPPQQDDSDTPGESPDELDRRCGLSRQLGRGMFRPTNVRDTGGSVTAGNETINGSDGVSEPGAPRDWIQTVTRQTFDALVLEGRGPIVVEFMSYGCAHCRVIEPVLQQVAATTSRREKFFGVNIAVDEGLAGSYGIQGTPTLVMFLDGVEVGRAEGPRPTLASVLAVCAQPFES